MSLPKEVFSGIPDDEFLEVGAYTLERAEDVSVVPITETVRLSQEYAGYLKAANYIGGQIARRERRKEFGKAAQTGMLRLGLAIREWFYFQELSGQADEKTRQMYSWMREITSQEMIPSVDRYFQQEDLHAKLAGEDARFDPVPPELSSAHEDFPAFAAFGDLLEQRLVAGGIESGRASEYVVGVDLGIIAIRETVEAHNMNALIRI